MAYVYRHIRLDKNEPFYIGIGKEDDGVYKRAYEKACSRKKSHIWKLITNKTDHEVDIMFYNITWGQACLKEKEFIILYGRIDKGNGILANMTDGGDGSKGHIVSQEIKNRHSERMKGKRYSLGFKQSKETISKRVESLKNRKWTPEQRAKMIPILALLNKGREKSSETIEKMRIASTGKKHTQESKNKMSIAQTGKKRSAETIEKMRLISLGNKNMLGQKMSEETKRKISLTKMGTKHTEEAKRKIGLASKARQAKK